MGRQQYLTRLALGRSPFLEATNEQHADVKVDQDGHDASKTEEPAYRGYTQQYNSKGRPINPTTEARNAEMRRAQNSVLALVGVVESREHSQRESEVELRRANEELREAEDGTGFLLEIAVMLIQRPLTWWIDSMSKRYQIGLYDSHKPFTYYLRATLGSACTGGVRGAYCTLFAGGAAGLLHASARMASHLVVELTAESMKEAILRQDWRSETVRWLDLALQCVEVAVLRSVDILLLPMEKRPLPRELFAWLFYPAYNVRVFLLEWCGWDLLSLRRDPPSPGVKGYITVRDGVDGLQIGTFHQMTTLAHMSAQFVASSIDDLLYRLAALPLDVILSRAVAVSYITSPLPKTLQAASMDPWLYAPLESGVHMHMQIGAYASKIGLSIALWSVTDVLIFAGLHALVRSQGMRHFGWARSSSTRSFDFPESLVPKSEAPLRRESTAIPSREER
ncbi:hypothetical protein LTR48_003660 [Friedmanniomyces endolithicus]|uniref:Uncharacterized protein n=1 Tax=Rachicladosporium monterosium TaxID=1507873 RepID=A0ABR0L7M5_9PEZI|nr:hypothetical protein LTR48_003660 [Friedmanniomyces endolithicus]KAK5144769.1 hypothetical protein LTR32_003367 [Rachicladosporium monterosium]